MRILLIEPYFGGSHKAWAEGYARHSRHHVELLTLPARFWKWRMQGAAATLAERARKAHQQPDLLLVTDMLNLPTFLGLSRRWLANVPAVLYCHENQLTYPPPPGEKRDLSYAMINWLSMVVADRILFNSEYHLQEWFEELPRMLKHFPDHTHTSRIPAVREKASVLPVGCDLERLGRVQAEAKPRTVPLIVWNQRWEYDKAPEVFLQALDVLAQDELDFEVALAGANVRQMPQEFNAARERLGSRIIHSGHAPESLYAKLLWQADIVASTALHEFFGVSVVEAVYCGCFPVLPQRVAYPEIIPRRYHSKCLYTGFNGLVERLRWALARPLEAREISGALQRSMSHYDWSSLGPQYDQVMERVV